MKFALSTLLLVATSCLSCERADIETLRKDVEAAYLSKSFVSLVDKYGEFDGVQIVLEDEYDEKNPTVVYKFGSIAELSKWFFEKHEFNEQMLLPAPVVCRERGCKYQLPELTLHHGTYLLGFESKTVGRCTKLTQIHIYWG